MPVYPLYALLLAGEGLGDATVAALLATWSAVSIAAEVPTGVLADRWSRRGCLVLAMLLQAAAFGLWLLVLAGWLPTVAGFGAGFALWGVGGALTSGAFDALLYEGLAAAGAADRYAAVLGRCEAATMLVQLPVAGAATALVALGGIPAAVWASAATALAAAALAARLPEGGDGEPADGQVDPVARLGGADVAEPPDPATSGGGSSAAELPDGRAAGGGGLRAALQLLGGDRALCGIVAAIALLTGLDAVEEVSPLLAAGWGIPPAQIPLALLLVPALGAAGSALGARLERAGPGAVGGLAAAAVAGLAAAEALAGPLGIVPLAAAYGLGRLLLVAASARLQHRVRDDAVRATTTSLAGLLGEAAIIGAFAVWAVGGLPALLAVAAAVAVALPRLLRGS